MTYAFRSLIAGATLFAAVVSGGHAEAADQAVSGKKLLLKSNPKLVLLSKDGLVAAGANGSSADPRCVPDGGGGLGGSVKLDDGTNSVTLSMPCANWSTNGGGTLYKYKDAAGVPKIGKIKAGLLKVVSPGMGGFPVPNGAATVYVEVEVGSDKYCMTFVGTGDGSKFLVKDVAASVCGAPTATPTPTPTSTPTASPTPTTGSPVTYSGDVQPILAAKCAPCHTTLGSGGANLATSYTDSQLPSYYCAGQTKGACGLVRVQNGSMPLGAGCTGNPVSDIGNPACLTAAEQSTLADWIAQGQLP